MHFSGLAECQEEYPITQMRLQDGIMYQVLERTFLSLLPSSLYSLLEAFLGLEKHLKTLGVKEQLL